MPKRSIRDSRPPDSFPTYSEQRRFLGVSRAHQLAGGDPPDSSPSAAAPAAGRWGIDGFRRVYSLGVRGWLAGGAMEAEARPEKLFGGGGPLLCPWSSGGDPKQICLPWHVCCSPESRRAVPEPAAVVAAAALALGVVLSPPTCGGVLLLKISGSLQGGSSPSSAASVGSAEDGWRPCIRLRREVMMAAWRRLEADTPSASRFRGLRRDRKSVV